VPEARPGDTVVIDGAGMAGLPRTGTIIAVGQQGEPPYLIRWTAGDYDSWFTPGPGARIENTPDRPGAAGVRHVIQRGHGR
jgi:hypothetical protein